MIGRNHPHLQGLVLGSTLLVAAVVATPHAVSCIRDLGHAPAADSPAESAGNEAAVSPPE